MLRAPATTLELAASEVDATAAEVIALAADLVATMRSQAGCVGLAAPQVGVPMRVFCLDVTGSRKLTTCHGLVVLANPRVEATDGTIVAREGCLSVPDLTGDVARPEALVVTGQRPGSGEVRTYEVSAFEARAFCHELDHLDGLLFLDRVAGAHAVHPRKRYL